MTKPREVSLLKMGQVSLVAMMLALTACSDDDDDDDMGGTPDEVVDTDGDGTPDNQEDDGDFDGDGIPNVDDDDDDGDGTPDATDDDPFTPIDNGGDGGDGGDGGTPNPGGDVDTDGDGIPNSSDIDSDGDGSLDPFDPEPFNPDVTAEDTTTDTDGDGTPDSGDIRPNDPSLGAPDADADGDGFLDNEDVSPRNPNEPQNTIDAGGGGNGGGETPDETDTDGDGDPDSTDPDDDNDGTPDEEDDTPLGEDGGDGGNGGEDNGTPPGAGVLPDNATAFETNSTSGTSFSVGFGDNQSVTIRSPNFTNQTLTGGSAANGVITFDNGDYVAKTSEVGADLDFSAYGVWYSRTLGEGGGFIGYPREGVEVPTTGTATYNGQALAIVEDTAAGTVSEDSGSFNATADFGTGTIDGNIDTSAVDLDFSTTIGRNNAEFRDTVPTLSGGDFTTGQVEGRFAGTNASEVVGTFSAEGTAQSVRGAFGGVGSAAAPPPTDTGADDATPTN